MWHTMTQWHFSLIYPRLAGLIYLIIDRSAASVYTISSSLGAQQLVGCMLCVESSSGMFLGWNAVYVVFDNKFNSPPWYILEFHPFQAEQALISRVLFFLSSWVEKISRVWFFLNSTKMSSWQRETQYFRLYKANVRTCSFSAVRTHLRPVFLSFMSSTL